MVANLKGHEDEFDALVFGCGDAVPVFSENAGKQYNQDMLAVIKAFGDKGKMMIGHCAAALMFEIAGVPEETAKEALRLASHKLPCRCKIVSKADLEGGVSNEN